MSYLNNELKITYKGGRQEIFITGSTIDGYEYNDQNIIAVEVPEIVQTIGEYAFCDNNDLANIVLNEGLQRIEGQAFQHGVYTAVTIPSTVTYIGWNSFNTEDEQFDDHHTFTVTCLATTPPELEDEEGITFGNPQYLSAIYVPEESVSAYQEAWPAYASKIYAIGSRPKYLFNKYMMAARRVAVAKAFNSKELKNPFAVVMDGQFFTEKGLHDDVGLTYDWYIHVLTSNPKKAPASTPTEFKCVWEVADNGEGLKTGVLGVYDFEAITEERELMGKFYSYIPAGAGLQLMNDGDGFEGLWHINSKGDYVDGETFTFEEDTESFTITWQDDIPGDKGEIVTGFVVRTTPHTEPEK